MILTWTCKRCGWNNDNNNGPCRKCGWHNIAAGAVFAAITYAGICLLFLTL